MNLTKEQKEWVDKYESATGFDVIFQGDQKCFEEVAQWNVDWLESYQNETLRALQHFPKSDEYYNNLFK